MTKMILRATTMSMETTNEGQGKVATLTYKTLMSTIHGFYFYFFKTECTKISWKSILCASVLHSHPQRRRETLGDRGGCAREVAILTESFSLIICILMLPVL